jgi:hypothetical protein
MVLTLTKNALEAYKLGHLSKFGVGELCRTIRKLHRHRVSLHVQLRQLTEQIQVIEYTTKYPITVEYPSGAKQTYSTQEEHIDDIISAIEQYFPKLANIEHQDLRFMNVNTL